jgi:hypothetical protein
LPYRFLDRYVDGHIKSIFRPRKFHHAMPHFPKTDGASTIICRDVLGQQHPCDVSQSPTPLDGPAWIAHYFFRSVEEFIWKWARGLGDDPSEVGRSEVTVPEPHMEGFLRQHIELPLIRDERMILCAELMQEEAQRLMGLPGVAAAVAGVQQHYSEKSNALAENIRALGPAASPQAAAFYNLLIA